MGLFGLGAKRDPVPEPIALRPTPRTGTPATLPLRSNGGAGTTCTVFAAAKPDRLGMSTRGPGMDSREDVEVRELDLDDEEFSSTFGSGTTQFGDSALGRDDPVDDPWTSRLRLD
ncbi:hypothetical protein [Piscinibacter sp.]|uniref:hypothetical protein n=1 Tax=Piscinibacter sp. TaxID=1903157 RepID=UPI002C28851F|nr:hypothetical protein [Albitalea sp.]HUG22703.1 hypothetical protein [Albitalea sp.]